MIPKVIHYCWFGKKPKPEKIRKCIESWRVQCPDWQIKEWNENNYNCNSHPYTRWCLENGKWAFLSDLARLRIIYTQGGIYLDTDVELIRPLDPLLDNKAFFCFETPQFVNTGLGFGAEGGSETVRAMIQSYDRFVYGEAISPVNCPRLNTEALVALGLKQDGSKQSVSDALILPVECFNPYDDPTGRLQVTENTFGIHWYFKSALPVQAVFISKLTRPFHRVFGSQCFTWIKTKKSG